MAMHQLVELVPCWEGGLLEGDDVIVILLEVTDGVLPYTDRARSFIGRAPRLSTVETGTNSTE